MALKHYHMEILDNLVKNQEPTIKKIFESGARFSGKTYGDTEFCAYALNSVPQVRVIGIRRVGKDADELWDDFVEIFKDSIPKPKINKTKHEILLGNGNLFKLYTLNEERLKSPKVGLKTRGKYRYNIVFWDECYDIKDEFLTNFNLSVRSDMPEYFNIYIQTWNTWNAQNAHVRRFAQVLPGDEKLLRERGYQFKRVGDAVYMRNNWRDNKYINKQQIDEIEQIQYWDYEQYRVVGLGLDGNAVGGVFTTSLQYMRPVDLRNPGTLYFGIDWGDSTLPNGGKLAVHALIVDMRTKRIDSIASIKFDNSKLHYSDTQLMVESIKWIETIQRNRGVSTSRVNVDNASHKQFYLTWKSISHQLNIYSLDFQAVDNDYKVKLANEAYRANMTNFLLSNRQWGVDTSTCADFWADLKLIHYDIKNDNPDKWVIHHDGTDGWDAAMYAIGYQILELAPKPLFIKGVSTNEALKIMKYSRNDNA